VKGPCTFRFLPGMSTVVHGRADVFRGCEVARQAWTLAKPHELVHDASTWCGVRPAWIQENALARSVPDIKDLHKLSQRRVLQA
jgi:hypothetical protein